MELLSASSAFSAVKRTESDDRQATSHKASHEPRAASREARIPIRGHRPPSAVLAVPSPLVPRSPACSFAAANDQ